MSRSSLSLPIFSFSLADLVALPVLAVGANLFAGGTGETWGHLMATVLPEYVANSVWLCLGVGIGVAAMGTGAAWLVALNDFPGRRSASAFQRTGSAQVLGAVRFRAWPAPHFTTCRRLSKSASA